MSFMRLSFSLCFLEAWVTGGYVDVVEQLGVGDFPAAVAVDGEEEVFELFGLDPDAHFEEDPAELVLGDAAVVVFVHVREDLLERLALLARKPVHADHELHLPVERGVRGKDVFVLLVVLLEDVVELRGRDRPVVADVDDFEEL